MGGDGEGRQWEEIAPPFPLKSDSLSVRGVECHVGLSSRSGASHELVGPKMNFMFRGHHFVLQQERFVQGNH